MAIDNKFLFELLKEVDDLKVQQIKVMYTIDAIRTRILIHIDPNEIPDSYPSVSKTIELDEKTITPKTTESAIISECYTSPEGIKFFRIPTISNYLISYCGRVIRIEEIEENENEIMKVYKELKHQWLGPLPKYEYINGEKVMKKDYRRPGVSIRINKRKTKSFHITKLLSMAFKNVKPNVTEKKIKYNSVNNVVEEDTVMIFEKIDESKPATIDNLVLNYIKRGIRHPSHKLTNDIVKMIRSNLGMKPKEFWRLFGHMFEKPVGLQTIRNVFRGKSWRVRVKPLAKMTFSGEDYPNGYTLSNIKV